MELKISGVASYKSPVNIIIDKKINLFYGLNGSGKTTITNFLQDPNHECYRNCCISGAVDKNFLIYNENFINKNFYESAVQRGIFTLGVENKEAESNIENARNQIGQLNDKKQECEELIKWETNQNIENENSIKERVWRIKTSYENSALDFCLAGLKNSKEKLFGTLLGAEPETDTSITIHDLESDIKKIEGDDAIIKATIPKIPMNTIPIENDKIFQEIIIGNEDNPLSKLINDLSNSDWVKSGIRFLDSQNICPFCQKELEANLISKLRDYFDENYKQKINALNELKTQYLNEILKFPDIEELKSEKFIAECPPFIEELLSLKNILDQNLASIEKKINEPSKKLNLIETSEYLRKIDRYITEINNNIQIHNENIQNKKEFKKRIKNAFWGCVRREYDADIKKYLRDKSEYNLEIEKINKEININIPTQIQTFNNIIIENQKKITNIELSIQNINDYLKYLAIDSFQIEKSGENYYRIVRGTDNCAEFKSLSEGEKTIISFLYFLELCQGSLTLDTAVDKANKIIIIDDPVSSLSNTYVFNIADLIKSRFEVNYDKICIFTHNLYFFHELCLIFKDHKNLGLFRLSKNIETQIRELGINEIQNDYAAYWSIIKDFDRDIYAVSNSLLAISMRNIIEHFFTFINKRKNLNEIMMDIKKIDSNYATFQRYMNRSAHSDSINLSEINDIDPHIFRKAFEEIFKKTGYDGHYNKMLS